MKRNIIFANVAVKITTVRQHFAGTKNNPFTRSMQDSVKALPSL